MKIRTDFVTNSSSCSYCVEVQIEDKNNQVHQWTVMPDYDKVTMNTSWSDIRNAKNIKELCWMLWDSVEFAMDEEEYNNWALRDYIRNGKPVISEMTEIGELPEESPLDGKRVVFTGFTADDEDYLKYKNCWDHKNGGFRIEDFGGIQQETADETTDVVIYNPRCEKATADYLKAKELSAAGNSICCISLMTICELLPEYENLTADLRVFAEGDSIEKYVRGTVKNSFDKFQKELSEHAHSVTDIRKIRLVKEFHAYGESSGCVVLNDTELNELAEKVVHTRGEEHEAAVLKMREYLEHPGLQVDISYDADYYPWPSSFSGADECVYNWGAVTSNIDELAKMILAEKVSSDDAGYEWKEWNLETGETTCGAEFTMEKSRY